MARQGNGLAFVSPYVAGLDLGEEVDYTALNIMRVDDPEMGNEHPRMTVLHLERYRNVLYPDVANKVLQRLMKPPIWGQVELVVDATGVGRAVTDIFSKLSVPFRGVVITGGDNETISGGWQRDEYGNEFHRPVYHRVPKKTLVGAAIVPFQQGLLKISRRLALAETFRKEMAGFRWKQNPRTGNETVEHREGEHDDLILSVSLSAWSALRFGGGDVDEKMVGVGLDGGTRAVVDRYEHAMSEVTALDDWWKDEAW